MRIICQAEPNVDIENFSFMTTLRNVLTTTINHKRSPVLQEQFSTWLAGSPKGREPSQGNSTSQIGQAGIGGCAGRHPSCLHC